MTKLQELQAELEELKKSSQNLNDVAEINNVVSQIKDLKAKIELQAELEDTEKDEIKNKLKKNRIEILDPEDKDNKKLEVLGTDEYRDMFYSAIRTGNIEEIKNVITVGTGNTIPVPTSFSDKLIEALREKNFMRELGTVDKSSSDKEIPMAVSIGKAKWEDEGEKQNESDDEFVSIKFKAFKVTKLIKVSEEAIDDTSFNLEDLLVRNLSIAIGIAEEETMLVGDGDGKPSGIMKEAKLGVVTESATAITSDDIIDLYYSVSKPYRKKAVFIMNDNTAKAIRKLKDNDGNYIWQEGLNGEPETILGKPLYTSEYVDEIGTGKTIMSFGDVSFYQILDRSGVTLQKLSELYAENGLVGFRGKKRTDGHLTLKDAVKKMQMK